ncbi:MAG: hypothetical protein AB8E74_02050, partial [Prochlorococcus sp.]
SSEALDYYFHLNIHKLAARTPSQTAEKLQPETLGKPIPQLRMTLNQDSGTSRDQLQSLL